MLRKTGLRDTLFIAMSNYYYEEKTKYLTALNSARNGMHDLTPFLKFGLIGVEKQCRLLLAQIRRELKKALYRNTYTDLFGRLQTTRKRVISERHIKLLHLLLQVESMTLSELTEKSRHLYNVKNGYKALIRDLNYLIGLGALAVEQQKDKQYVLWNDLEWPTQITETEFFRKVREMPKAKVAGFLSA